ncbi:uncharacterized protein LOC122322486 [Drosophila grimshawi]|uniref:uncharacterized protein LOC122322486 n=1 Tax=Drosophila grimshawi TaxID=7222 RepID=UPI001C936182|nr:uncharacterized protein LOC122322486 [Drosophila grimshawi]
MRNYYRQAYGKIPDGAPGQFNAEPEPTAIAKESYKDKILTASFYDSYQRLWTAAAFATRFHTLQDVGCYIGHIAEVAAAAAERAKQSPIINVSCVFAVGGGSGDGGSNSSSTRKYTHELIMQQQQQTPVGVGANPMHYFLFPIWTWIRCWSTTNMLISMYVTRTVKTGRTHFSL